MKTGRLLILFICLIACRNKEETKDVVEIYNLQTQKDLETGKDEEFLAYAQELNLKEIKLAQLAQLNSIKPETQNWARNLEKFHLQLYEELKQTSSGKIKEPTLSYKENSIYKKMKYEIADDFEKDFFNKLSVDYTYAIERFEYTSNHTQNKELNLWVKSKLPLIRKIMGEVKIFEAEVNKKTTLK